MQTLRYKPKFDNIDSFIAYKFSIMPSSVVDDNSFEESYPLIFMNNEILYAFEIELSDIFDFLNLDEFINMRKLINEEINFYDSYNNQIQILSKKYKNKATDIISRIAIEDMNVAKYLCFKEAYDLELGEDKINNFNINKAVAIKNVIDKILSPIYNEQTSYSVRKNIINSLDSDININKISTTFESGYTLYNINHFKALICSNEILNKIEILFNQNKLSSEAINFCIDVLTCSISAKNRLLKKSKQFVIDNNDLETFDKKSAEKIKNKLICEKYRKFNY